MVAADGSRRALIVDAHDAHGPVLRRALNKLGWSAVLVDALVPAERLIADGLEVTLVVLDESLASTRARPADRFRPLVLSGRAIAVLYVSDDARHARRPRSSAPGVLIRPFTLDELERQVGETVAPARLDT